MEDSFVPVGNYQLVKLFLLSCLVSVVKTLTDQVLPPQNVTISWINYFYVNVAWIPPENGKHCEYELILNGYPALLKGLNYSAHVQLDNGAFEISLESVCDQIKSDPVKLNITYPVLVRDFQCSFVSSNLTDCSWNATRNVTDFRVFYWPVNDDGTLKDGNINEDLKECAEYQYIEGIKSGCHLQDNFLSYTLHFLINGTLDNRLINNTFETRPRNNIRLHPLNWTVTEIGDQLEIKWIPPNMEFVWKYTINYTECGERQIKSVSGDTSINLTVNPHCQYRISIQGVNSNGFGNWKTLWSKERVYGENKNPNAVMQTLLIAITVIIIVAALAIVCLRKHKEKILPKVPEPSILLKEMLNRPMNIVGELYTPVQEEQNNKITLVVEQQPTTPHC